MFLKVTQKAKISISIKDKHGNEAKVDGLPLWSLSSDLAEMTVAADGMSAELAPKGTVGACLVQVKCDADLGEGVKEILGELNLDLLAGDAESVSLSGEVIAETPVEAPVEIPVE